MAGARQSADRAWALEAPPEAFVAQTWALDPPAPSDRKDLARPEAATLVDGLLARVARRSGALEVAIGEALDALARGDGFVRLGFSCLRDYARERLGMRETAARNVSRLARELRARPLLRAAVRSGVVSARKAQVILPLASSTDEAAWVERARTETVRALEVAVRAARSDAAQASVQVEEEWERVNRDLHRAAPGDRRRGGHADVCGGPDHAPGPPAGADPVRRGGPRRAGGLRRVAFARRVPGKDGGALHSDLGAAPSAPPHARTAGARSRRRPLPGPRLLAACRPGPPHRAPLRRRRGRRPEPHLALRRPPPARRARGQRQRPRRGAGPAGVATRTARVAVHDERRESNSVHGQRPSTAPPVPGGYAQDERAQSNSVHRERPSTSPPCVRLRSGRTGESNSVHPERSAAEGGAESKGARPRGFSGTAAIVCSASAVIVSAGFTPRFAGIALPSAT